MTQSKVIRFKPVHLDDGTVIVKGDKALVLDISSLLGGPLVDLALSMIVSSFDDRIAGYFETDYVCPRHDWKLNARAFVQLEYEVDDDVDHEIAVPVSDKMQLCEIYESPYSIPIGKIPQLLEKLQRIYNNTDPEDYRETVDLLDVIAD